MKTKKVLIVDNNDLNRKLFESLIGQTYSFVAVRNGLEAVKKASSEKFDLILMDIHMPEMDGFTALKTIRRKAEHQCPIIAVTNYSTITAKNGFLEMGFDDLITKPIRPKEFLEVIADIINEKKEDKSKTEVDTLDKKVFLQLLKYNPLETIMSIYADFLDEFDQLIYELDIAFPKRNKQVLIESLHTLKGNSGTLGANAIFILSRQADQNVRAQDWESLGEVLKKLKNERIIFENYLKEETTFNP